MNLPKAKKETKKEKSIRIKLINMMIKDARKILKMYGISI